ncbi:MAG: hypothetical protein U9Q62_00660 [Campylobacterota bacterium]|nr:hypothetical protein [Campylobacterota bacterium]
MVKFGNSGVLLGRVLFLVLSWVSFSMAGTTYPHLYKAIGTPIYQAADGYRTLLDSEHFITSKEAMLHYIRESDTLRSEGFRLDESSEKADRKVYIDALRQLEQKRDEIDRRLVKSIQTLKSKKFNAELSVLAKNPYSLIREVSKIPEKRKRMSESKHAAVIEKDSETLRRSLVALTDELQQARADNAENVACLNDITAINYWMLKADQLKAEREWCKASDVCRQISEFEHAARKTCGKEESRYLEWSGASASYRTTLKQMFDEACHR